MRTTLIPIHRIPGPDGRTTYDENMEKQHKIPLGTLVQVKGSEWFGEGACVRWEARLWVVKHTRDCDGTPLYTLSPTRDVRGGGVPLTFGIQRGYPEYWLTPIEVTPALVYGTDALEWEDRE